MAFTSDDIDAIDRAIASGEMIVRMGDRLVQYRTLDELLAARDRISAVIASDSSTSRAYPRFQQARFADD